MKIFIIPNGLRQLSLPTRRAVTAGRSFRGMTYQRRMRPPALLTYDELVYAALRAGASGFLLKDTPPAELLAWVVAVHACGYLLHKHRDA
jgi:DNA-binding NarL/FixJ family response regulator